MPSRPYLSRFLTSRWTPMAVLFLGLGCTALAANEIHRSTRERDHQRFENVARRLGVAVDHRMEAYVALLRATSGMLDRESGYVMPRSFRAFVAAMKPHEFPGAEGIGYSRRLVAKDLVPFREEARRLYDPDFDVYPAEPARPHYYPLIMVDRPDGLNRSGIGFDMWTDPNLRAAMERARDTGAVTATEPVSLALASAGPPRRGLMMFVPVFKKDARPTTPKERQDNLAGFASAAFRSDDLFAAIFAAHPSADATFTIRDELPGRPDTAGQFDDPGLLFRSPGEPAAADARFHTAVPVKVAGRNWTLTAHSTPAFEATLDRGLTPSVAVGGTAVSLVLAGLVRLQVKARATAVREHALAVRAEREARTAADRLELVLRGSGVGMWYSDLPFAQLRWDERVRSLFFLGDDPDLTVEKAFERVHPDDRDRTRAAMGWSVKELAPFDVEYRTVSPDGTRTNWLRSIGQAFADDAGVPVRFDVLTIDVTALKSALETAETAVHTAEAARESAELARESAEMAGRIKDEFLATLSHELRTPLNAIVGWSQLLRRGGPVAPEVDHGLTVIERNAKVQTQLVSDLLDMSRVVSGKLRLDARAVDVGHVAAAAAESARPAADAKGVAVELVGTNGSSAATTGEGLTVCGDAGRLQQVAWNLLSNAVKFTPRGGRVRMTVARTGQTVTLAVVDSGEGIAPDFLPHVFDRFRQADATAARRHGGLGLGLAIVKQLVDLHGGTVRAESQGAGTGATFVVELPAASGASDCAAGSGVQRLTDGEAADDRPIMTSAAAPGTDGSPAAEPAAADESQGDGQPTSLAGLSVLAVDDEPDARELVRRLLVDAGARVTVAASAAEGLDLLRRGRPDVVVSDIGMPGQDGYAFVRAVRKLPAADGGNTPALALTAFARSEDRVRALLVGYQAHVAKPADPAELVRAVAALAGRAGTGAAVMN